MNIAAALLEEAQHLGVSVEVDGPRLRLKGSPPAELVELLREHKPEVLRELRRRQALQMLADDPKLKRAYVLDADSDPDHVLVLLAVRGVGSCDIEVPRPKWDPIIFLKFLEARSQ